MTPTPAPIRLDRGIRTTLCALRRRMRCYVWMQGLAAVAAALGIVFWASLGSDWFFEPTVAVRKMLLAAGALTVAVVAWRTIGRRALVPLPDHSMAILLERRFSRFDDSLLTAVELTAQPPEADERHQAMLAATCRTAAEPIGEIRLGEVFDPRPLRLALFAAVVLATASVAFRVAAPESFGVWYRRAVLMSSELWPRRVALSVEGFPDGIARVARGADFTLLAKADMAAELVPRSVQVSYRAEGAPRLSATMIREGRAVAGRDSHQVYSHTFRGVLEPIEMDLRGGDAAIRGLRLEVVDAPTLVRLEAECRYPKYMGRPSRTVSAAGVVPIPRGTQVVLAAESNKPLVEVRIDDGERTQVVMPSGVQTESVTPSGDSGATFRRFNFRLQPLLETKTLELTLHDADGITSRRPIRLTLSAVEDQPPRAAVQLLGIGSAVTPQAQLPFAGRVADDYGVDRVWLEYAVEGRELRRTTLKQIKYMVTNVPIDDAFEVDPLALEPGEKILLSLKAQDRCDLADGPNVGSGDRWILDVVTPERLRAILEAREIVLRQRFETIVEDVEQIRKTLAELDFGAEKPEPDAEAGREPSDEKVLDSPERRRAIRLLRIQRARQNGQKDTHETAGVAEAFTDIRQELMNNRIYTEELRIRLEQDIVLPLEGLVETEFVELDERLARLESTHDDAASSPGLRDEAVTQADAILTTMRQVLSRMVELEDFNEAVQLLRSIIEEQEQLRKATRERRKEKLQQLLGD